MTITSSQRPICTDVTLAVESILLMTQRVRRTVSLDPYSDKLIKCIQVELIRRGWPRATYTRALKALLIAIFYTILYFHKVKQGVDDETTVLIRECLLGKRHMSEKDFETFQRWLEKRGEDGCLAPP